MSKKDVIIEKIGFLKLLVGGAVTALFLLLFHLCTNTPLVIDSLISWLTDYFLIIFLIISLLYILHWSKNKINKLLEDLENE